MQCLVTAWQVHGSLSDPPGLCWLRWGDSFFCGVCLEKSLFFIKSFLSCYDVLFLVWSFARDGSFCWDFLCLYLLVFPGCHFSPSLGHMRQKENSGNSPLCCFSGPELARQSATFFPHLRVFLCLFYIQCPEV